MAEAYLALAGEMSGLRSLVVVKRILPHLSSNEQFIHMFLDEARIGALLDHPNIVRIIEVARDRDGYFLVMEPVQGKPLSAVLRRAAKRKSPLGHAQAAFIVGQAADGLGYAHGLADAEGRSFNVVHRDVSPENILVSFEGAVKVIDFGIASALGRLTETVPGGLKGKIEYMSPEHASGGTVDSRSDVFALGTVLWEALCGRRLFRRTQKIDTMRAIVDDPIPRPSRIVPVSPGLERIVMRALEKDPEDRFQDAREMALLLQRHAFASSGFSPARLAAQMKRLFAADHAAWKATSGAALGIEGGRRRKITATFPLVVSTGVETSGRTVVLRAGPAPEHDLDHAGWGSIDDDPASDSRDSSIPGPALDSGPPRRSAWRWAAGGVALLGLIGGAYLARVRSGTAAAPTPIRATNIGRPTGSTPLLPAPVQPLPPLVVPVAPAPTPPEPEVAGAHWAAPAASLPEEAREASAPTPSPLPPVARPSEHDPVASKPRPWAPARLTKPAASKRAVAHRTPPVAHRTPPKVIPAPAKTISPGKVIPAPAKTTTPGKVWRDPFQ
jgi:serine/threonine-protein kinase